MTASYQIILVQGASQNIRVSPLTDNLGNFVNDATVTATLKDRAGNTVTGIDALALAYVAASDGIYEGTVPPSFAPVPGTGYTLHVDAAHGGDSLALEIPCIVQIEGEPSVEIASLTELATYLSRALTAGSREDLIRRGVNAGIETYCHREFVADGVDRSEYHYIKTDYRDALIVKKPPIISLTSLQVGPAASKTIVAATDYVVEDAEAGIIRRLIGKFYPTDYLAWANYRGGFTAIPLHVKLVALSAAAREIEKAVHNRHGLTGTGFQGGSVTFFILGMTPQEREVLDGFNLEV